MNNRINSSRSATCHRRFAFAAPIDSRRGAFTVEFALVASIFFTVLLSSFEFSRLYFARHSLDQAAYEAVRVGIIPGATPQTVSDRANQVLSAMGISPKTITVTPTAFNEKTEKVTVKITCDVSANSWIPSRFFLNPEISATTTLDHENRSYLMLPDVNDEVGDNDNEPVDK
jgi:Flp pilus assembly protein TadG